MIRANENKLNSKLAQIEGLFALIKTKSRDNDQLTEDLEILQKELNTTKNQIVSCKDQNRDLKDSLDNKQNHIARLEDKSDDLNTRLNQLTIKVVELSQQYSFDINEVPDLKLNDRNGRPLKDWRELTGKLASISKLESDDKSFYTHNDRSGLKSRNRSIRSIAD